MNKINRICGDILFKYFNIISNFLCTLNILEKSTPKHGGSMSNIALSNINFLKHKYFLHFFVIFCNFSINLHPTWWILQTIKTFYLYEISKFLNYFLYFYRILSNFFNNSTPNLVGFIILRFPKRIIVYSLREDQFLHFIFMPKSWLDSKILKAIHPWTMVFENLLFFTIFPHFLNDIKVQHPFCWIFNLHFAKRIVKSYTFKVDNSLILFLCTSYFIWKDFNL